MTNKESQSIMKPLEVIENKILLLRGHKVMLDRDLAVLYGVEVRSLNQAVKRNIERFPSDFMFQLTQMETDFLVSDGAISLRSQIVTLNDDNISHKNGQNKAKNLISQSVISKKEASRSQFVILNDGIKRGENIKFMPFVFTEQGVAMLSSVLKSPKAIEMNIVIMRAFVKIRNLIYSYKDLAEKIEKMERKYDKQIGSIFAVLDKLKIQDEVRPADAKAMAGEEKKEIGFKAKKKC